jgi:casein kinase II subunit alpha
LHLKWEPVDNYYCLHKLGRGKYSEVYEGANLKNNQKCVIKILKPVRIEKQFREVKILQTLYGGPNIVKLFDVLRDPTTQTPALVFEYIPNVETKLLARKFNHLDIRLYVYKMLEALDFAHSHGIMHRDMKPLNIVIDHDNRDLRVIDWGLADYYRPDTDYNTRVASRYYKSPELLVEDRKYNYSMDIWAVGCTFGGMMLKIDTLFRGSDNNDQLVKIVDVLGSAKLQDYMRKYKLNMPKQLIPLIKNTDERSWDSFVN